MSQEELIEKLYDNIVKNPEPFYEVVSCGVDYYICPFCQEEIDDTTKLDDSTNASIMDSIKHDKDCPYVLLKKYKEEE